MKSEIAAMKSKLDTVMDEISKAHIEKNETQARLTKLEDKEHLNHTRLRKVLPFAGIDQNLQTMAPGVARQEACAAWTQFQKPSTPPRTTPSRTRPAAVRAVQAQSYRAPLLSNMPR